MKLFVTPMYAIVLIIASLIAVIVAQSHTEFRTVPLYHGDEFFYVDDYFSPNVPDEGWFTSFVLQLDQSAGTPKIPQCDLRISSFTSTEPALPPILTAEVLIDVNSIIAKPAHVNNDILIEFIPDKGDQRFKIDTKGSYRLQYKCKIDENTWQSSLYGTMQVSSEYPTGSGSTRWNIRNPLLPLPKGTFPSHATAYGTYNREKSEPNNYNLGFSASFVSKYPTNTDDVTFSIVSNSLWIPTLVDKEKIGPKMNESDFYCSINGVNIPYERIVVESIPKLWTGGVIHIKPNDSEFEAILLPSPKDVTIATFSIHCNMIQFVVYDQEWSNAALAQPLKFHVILSGAQGTNVISAIKFWDVQPFAWHALPDIKVSNQIWPDSDSMLHAAVTFDFDSPRVGSKFFDSFNFTNSDIIITQSAENCQDPSKNDNLNENNMTVLHDTYRNNIGSNFRHINMTHVPPKDNDHSWEYIQENNISKSTYNLSSLILHNNSTKAQDTLTPPSRFQLRTDVHCKPVKSVRTPFNTTISLNAPLLQPSTSTEPTKYARNNMTHIASNIVLKSSVDEVIFTTKREDEPLALKLGGIDWPLPKSNPVEQDQLHIKMNFAYDTVSIIGNFSTCKLIHPETNQVIQDSVEMYALPGAMDDANFDGVITPINITNTIITEPISTFKLVLDRVKNPNPEYTAYPSLNFNCSDVYPISSITADKFVMAQDWLIVTSLLLQDGTESYHNNNNVDMTRDINDLLTDITINDDDLAVTFSLRDLTRRAIAPAVIQTGHDGGNNDDDKKSNWKKYVLIAVLVIVAIAIIGAAAMVLKVFINKKQNQNDASLLSDADYEAFS